MIGPGTGVRVYLACGVTDMRKGIAGLAALTQDVLHQKPASGAVFAFRGRRGDRIKLLYRDGQGFCLYCKLLEQGRFPWPGARDGAVCLTSAQRAMLWRGDRSATSRLGCAACACRVVLRPRSRYSHGVRTWSLGDGPMSEPAGNLPDDPAELRAMIAALQVENARVEAENAKISATLRVHDQLVQALRLRIAKLQKLAFGKSSEKIGREIEQLELALEDLLVAVAEEDDAPSDEGRNEPAIDEPLAPALRRRPRVLDTTPRERRELDPGACCPDCGGDLRVVGEDVSELLDMIAAQMKVIRIARVEKSCRRCERMVQEPAPSRPIPGSMAGPNLLAHVLVSKFDDHLPLSRQHEIFARMGADLPESTLVGRCGRAMKTLSPLIERSEADIMASDLLHADDTPIRVLDRSLRDKGLGRGVRQGRIWAYA